MDKRIKILIISAVILIVGGTVIGMAVANKEEGESQIAGSPKLEVSEKRYDLGTISMADGLARHRVELTNSGDGDLTLSSIKTSCMCTEAVLVAGGKKSPKFGMHTTSAFWSETIGPGESAELEIIYDPNAHGPEATGPVTRTVTLLSNDGNKVNARMDITFTANVIK